MLCPNCRNESNGNKWCPNCGIKLETDDISVNPFYDEDDGAEETIVPTGHSRSSNKGLLITLLVIISVVIVLAVVALVMKSGRFSDKGPSPEDIMVLEQENIDTLLKKGRTYLDTGDYDSAESVYKAVIEIDSSNEEATLLYRIVYNYNRAVSKIENKKFEDARNFYDKIPLDYMDYSIEDDVEKLDDEISRFEINNKIFEEIKGYMRNGNYADAADSIELLDKDCLTDSQISFLEEYEDEIADSKETEPSGDDETFENGMTVADAESFIKSHCKAFASAVNDGNFALVSPYLAGDLINHQKKAMDSYISDKLTLEFDYLKVNSVSQISENKWTADVSEGETIYYTDGSGRTRSFSRTYTIEKINDRMYLTKVE